MMKWTTRLVWVIGSTSGRDSPGRQMVKLEKRPALQQGDPPVRMDADRGWWRRSSGGNAHNNDTFEPSFIRSVGLASTTDLSSFPPGLISPYNTVINA